MDLQQVDVVCIEPLQTRLDSSKYGPSGQATVIHIVFRTRHLRIILVRVLLTNIAEALRKITTLSRGILYSLSALPMNLFRFAIGVDVGSVPSVEAAVVSCFE